MWCQSNRHDLRQLGCGARVFLTGMTFARGQVYVSPKKLDEKVARLPLKGIQRPWSCRCSNPRIACSSSVLRWDLQGRLHLGPAAQIQLHPQEPEPRRLGAVLSVRRQGRPVPFPVLHVRPLPTRSLTVFGGSDVGQTKYVRTSAASVPACPPDSDASSGEAAETPGNAWRRGGWHRGIGWRRRAQWRLPCPGAVGYDGSLSKHVCPCRRP